MYAYDQRGLLEWLSKLCDGSLSDDEGKHLADALRLSPEARVTYIRYIDLHASLSRAAALSTATTEFEARFQSSGLCQGSAITHPRQHRWLGGRYSTYAAATAIVVFVGTLGWWLIHPDDAAGVPARNVAQIIEQDNCRWEGAEGSYLVGTKLPAGTQLNLVSGVAKLQFEDETIVLIESPAAFEAVSESSLRLHSGTVALRANGPIKDFTVLASNASIVDLGTSFGVHSGPEGIDIEVFEGKVQVLPENDSARGQVLGLGASARVRESNGETGIGMFEGASGRFTDLLQLLWEEAHSSYSQPPNEDQNDERETGTIPRAEFADDVPNSPVNSFHGAGAGHGWVTPWLASGKPIGELVNDGALAGPDDPYLRLRFFRSYLRTVAREYGSTASLDPAKPHVISWLWRFDGEDNDFGNSFRDRIAFYGNDYFRANTSRDVTWLIGWVGDHERVGQRRDAIPKRWVLFDGMGGSDYDPSNLVDTGMILKPGVTYRMAVVLYPETKMYDAIIQDDEQVFVREGLGYRNPNAHSGRVLHFSVGTDPPDGDASFSVDAIRVEPLRRDLIPAH